MFTITTGYDASLAITLKKNGVVFDIPVSSTVQAAIVSSNQKEKLTGTVTAASDASGADWANSLLVIDIPATETAKVPPGDIKLEISVTDSIKEPWFLTGESQIGHI